MLNRYFIEYIVEQHEDESSMLRKTIAKTILMQKDSMRATQRILEDVKSLASQKGADEVKECLNNPSGIMISTVNTTIFYGANSVTANPNIPNSASTSPKAIADKVIVEIANLLTHEVLDED